ncbi:MAG: hypothetical protein MR646_12515 [Agathobacter sp.]|nr:hypothetical protein [Agathobacter sp.]
MRLLKIECKKIITHPFLWIVWVTFVLFQLFQIYGYVGNSFMQQDLQNMYTAVLGAGVAPEEAARNAGKEVTAAEKESHEYNEKSEIDRQGTYGESEYREAYEDYRSTYGGMYDNLDMMKILEKKQEMYNYHPKGNMQQFLEDNYRKLQFRVEAIRSTEENSYGFYPGNQYKIHSILYGHIWKSLILEGAVLMMLSVLFLMDYERINKTRDIVIATVAGKECMRYKILAGVLCGLFYDLCLLIVTMGCVFYFLPFRKLWKVPVASCMVAEARDQIMYPFITFFRMTEQQYLFFSMIVLIGIMLLVAGLAASLQYLLQNSYFTFAGMCILFMGLYIFAYEKTETLLDVVKALMNPAVLYITSGGWFMENSLELSFAGNEFISIAVCGGVVFLLLGLGRRRYLYQDII